jgi:hypothetical protein
LKYSSEYLSADVSKESIKQVQEISKVISDELAQIERRYTREDVEIAVLKWWKGQGLDIEPNIWPFPDFIINDSGERKIGVEVKFSEFPSDLARQLRLETYELENIITKQRFSEIVYTLVVPDDRSLYGELFHNIKTSKFPPKFRFILGLIKRNTDTGELIFTPEYEYP